MPTADLVAARIELHSGPGDVVADLFGRGGWVARSAVDLQRRGVSLESSPLTRMLAEVVMRPPDVRHLDAAFQGMAASPRGETSLKVSIGDLFATRCATCGRSLVVDAILWANEGAPHDAGTGDDEPRDGPDGPPGNREHGRSASHDGSPTHDGGAMTARPISRHYRCTVCRDQRGGSEHRQAPLDADDLARAMLDPGVAATRTLLRTRFPEIDGAPDLPDELLALHTPRQLIGLAAILERIEMDLRAAPILAALRLALLHAILPASRLATGPGRAGSLRIAGGHVRQPSVTQWRERNPWLAFEDAFRLVRGFIQRLDGGGLGPVQARLGEDLRSLGEGTATALLGLAGPSGLVALGDESSGYGRTAAAPRIRLVLGQPPLRPNLERLATTYHGTSWVLGREAASLLPIDALAGASLRPPWSWQAASIGRALAAVEPAMARDGRVVQLVDGGAEAVVAAVFGGATAGYRVLSARLADPDDEMPGIVELLPPGGSLPPGPRTRANVSLAPLPGGAGDPDTVPGRGIFAPRERFDQRPFSAADAAKTVTEAAVETLKARGEPARFERVLGEVLVGLDRAGQLRRLAAAIGPGAPGAGGLRGAGPQSLRDPGGRGRPVPRGRDIPATTSAFEAAAIQAGAWKTRTAAPEPVTWQDPVDALLSLIRDELTRPTQRRLSEIEPGRWWLADPADRDAAAVPLADRVEWAVFSLLSTAGPMPEADFYGRIASLFSGHDLPDEGLVRACLDSYRSPASTPDRLVTTDDLLRRSQEHTDLLARITDAGHRLGMRVWIGLREQSRRTREGALADRLDERERRAYLGAISRNAQDLAEVDAIWYIRGKVAFLFEVEWTAMLGEPLLHRHARIPADGSLIRFLVVLPQRAELVRYKLERSPLLRAALETGNWHIVRADHLRSFLARDPLDLADLEPYLGLDPLVDRSSEQLPLFGG